MKYNGFFFEFLATVVAFSAGTVAYYNVYNFLSAFPSAELAVLSLVLFFCTYHMLRNSRKLIEGSPPLGALFGFAMVGGVGLLIGMAIGFHSGANISVDPQSSGMIIIPYEQLWTLMWQLGVWFGGTTAIAVICRSFMHFVVNMFMRHNNR